MLRSHRWEGRGELGLEPAWEALWSRRAPALTGVGTERCGRSQGRLSAGSREGTEV